MTIKNSSDYRRILIRVPNWVGDAVMATPALRCLRHNFPQARIDVTLIPYVRTIVEGAPWFDEIIEYRRDGEHKGFSGHLRYLRILRRNRYDLAVLLPNSFSSALLVYLAGAKRRIGYNRDGRGFLLTDAIPAPTENGRFVPQPMTDYYLALCEKLGARAESTKTELFVDPASEQRAEELFGKYRLGGTNPVVAICPGAAFGSSKLWVSEYFARVADNLVRLENCDVVLLGGPNERPITGEIVAAARSELANLAEENTGLDIFKSIVKRCDLMISLDSGPRHFAVAFDKPVVVLMGSTNPKYTNCNLEKTTIVRVEDLDCIPCQLKQCPRERECMTRIAPETVFRAAIELLEKYVRRGRS